MFQIDNKRAFIPKNLNDFGYNLKACREYAGLSQQQLANKLNISRSTINDLENHKRYSVSIKILEKLLTLFNEEILLDEYTKILLNKNLNHYKNKET